MAVVLLNSTSDKYKDIKIELEYGRKQLTVEIITNALKNKALHVKSESKERQIGNNLLVKGKAFRKSNYHSSFSMKIKTN